MIDVSQVQFSSEFTIDKIQSWSSTTDASEGLAAHYTFTIPADSILPDLAAGTGSITNPYGRRGLPTVTWSIDQVNWYPTGGQILYYNGTFASYFTQIAVYLVTTDSQITFVVTTGYTSSQQVYVQFAVDNPI
jgi:hypothetical protein